jgi:glycerate kinase
MHKRCSEAEFVVLCDVRNPLTGPNGAAAVFGPQKGADQGMLELLGKGLERLSDLVKEGKGFDMGQTPFGGAAGGAAAGLQAFLGAKLVSGIECFLDLTGFDEALQEADVVVTGEGSLDAQTFEGKAPFGVAARAKQKGRRVVCLAGRITQDVQAVSGPFDVIMDINDGEGSLEEALRNTAFNLERVGSTIASLQA